jgi:hypothetical protein
MSAYILLFKLSYCATLHFSAPPRVASPTDQIFTRRSSVSSDQPLYESYCLGLDKVGLEEVYENYDSDFWDSDKEDDVYGVPNRTQSTPSIKSEGKINVGNRRLDFQLSTALLSHPKPVYFY